MRISLKNLNTSLYATLIGMTSQGMFLNRFNMETFLKILTIKTHILYTHIALLSILKLLPINFSLKKIHYQSLRAIRANNKFIQIFNETLFFHLCDSTWRLHPFYENQYTHSSRISCNNPNLQSFPSKNKFQSCLFPKYTNSIILGDFSSFELRILAHLSQDKKFITIFNSNLDPHNIVSMTLFGSTKHREIAKEITYAILYGMSTASLSRKISVSQSEANKFISHFFQTYPAIHVFLTKIQKTSMSSNFSKTLLGHPYKINPLIAPALKNIPIQGTAAEIIKATLINLDFSLSRFYKSFLVNMLHDEVIIECSIKDVDTLLPIIKSIMENTERTILTSVAPKATIKTIYNTQSSFI